MPVAAFGALGNNQRPSGILDGRSMNASNTGLNYHGINPASLTTQGAILYDSSFNGQTVSLKKFTGEVTITASNFTLKDCWMNWGGANTIALECSGSNNLIQGCLFSPTSSFYIAAIISGGSNNTVMRCDMSNTENGVT